VTFAATNGNGATQARAVGPFGKQICGGSAKYYKPHYKATIPTLTGAATSLSGAGATFPAPVYSYWTGAYNKDTGVQVAYQSIGSGGGIAQIQAKTVDFGQSDAPMSDAQLAAAQGGPLLHIPVVQGAVVVTYNVPGLGSGMKFTGDVIGKIFAGKITRWNDAELKALNPSFNLPDMPIAVAHRSDGSGTTAIFTRYMSQTSPTWVSTLGGQSQSQGTTVAWPVGIGGRGNEGVSGVVGQTQGAIGYVELTYALAQKLPYGQVKNHAGNFIQPCIPTAAEAANNARFAPDLRTWITNLPAKNAYPIAGTSFALVYVNQSDAGKAKALVNFFNWALTKGQDLAPDVYYAPLSAALQKRAYAQLGKILVNGKPLVKIGT
jgi:phosphate transport system substrate-binding protein